MVLFGFLAPGCWSARELNERALVVGVGIDPSELPGQFDFTFQILKPARPLLPGEVEAPLVAVAVEGRGPSG